ncbi:MAG: hypothetical protein ACR2RE_14755, partial [Geminicoccaceae bacterium]
HKGKSNAKELVFDVLDSSYRASTAGSKGAGRSETIQLFHGSEVAFWPNADEHLKGAMQAVPLLEGTEIILESTANGIGNPFHTAWQDAESGASDFIAVFVPWYWQSEYRRPVPDGFKLEDDELEYKQSYGLDDEQMCWRRHKIMELGGDIYSFQQEYPATAAEAFETSSEESLIKPPLVVKARKAKIEQLIDQPLVIGVDPAGEGEKADRTAIIRRKGRVVFGKETYQRKKTMQLVGIVAEIIEKEEPDKVFIDTGERGHGIVDRLHELGYTDQVVGVGFGVTAIRDDVYRNKRAEMWDTMRYWLEADGGAELPDDDELHADLVSVRRKKSSVTTK